MTDEKALFQVSSTSSTIDEFYLTITIDDFDSFLPLLSTLKAAKPNDSIIIYISSPGGFLEIGIPIINAITYSAATVTTVMSGSIASMAALIFLAGDIQIVEPYSLLMLHNYSSFATGKAHEVFADVIATKSWLDQLNTDICIPFLSQRELKQMQDGKDFYFNSEETIKRLKKRPKST